VGQPRGPGHVGQLLWTGEGFCTIDGLMTAGISKFGAVVFLAGVAVLTQVGFAGDWPQWRGPKRDGHSTDTGLLKQWPESGPPLVWSTNGLGGGFSSVSVAAGKIYTMGDATDACYLYALREADGKKLWAAKIGQTGGDHPGPRCTPTVDGEMVIALGQFGDLVALDCESGKERWRKNLTKDFSGKMMSGWGYSESPLIDSDRVVCTPGGSEGAMAALDKKTGSRPHGRA